MQKAHRCPPKSQKRNATSCAQKACKTKRRACATAQGGRPHNWDRQHTRWHEKGNKIFKCEKKKAFESLGEATKIGAHMPISEDAAILIVLSESHTAGSHSPHRERKTVTSAKVHDITKKCHIVNSIIAKNERNPISIFKP